MMLKKTFNLYVSDATHRSRHAPLTCDIPHTLTVPCLPMGHTKRLRPTYSVTVHTYEARYNVTMPEYKSKTYCLSDTVIAKLALLAKRYGSVNKALTALLKVKPTKKN